MTGEAFYKEIETSFNERRALIVYHKPASDSIIALIQKDDHLYRPTLRLNSGFVFAPFDPEANWVLIPEACSKRFSTPFRNEIINKISSEMDAYSSIPSEPEYHMKLVLKAKNTIVNSALEKVVLSRFFDLDCDHSATSIFKRLLNQNPKAMVYLFYHPEIGTWLGATPEQLLDVKNNQLTTVSLAGTKPAAAGAEINWSPKELDEQQIVTDYIEDVLRPHATKILKSEIETVEAGSVMHLKTKIKAELKDKLADLTPLIKALHPTPAVCGTPKSLAMDFINQEEGYDREFYTGFLGEINLKDIKSADLFVNLRCMKLHNGMARIFVGGGITSESDPNSEWLETVEKSKTMVKVIGFSGIE